MMIKRIAVLMGGTSSERAISLKSGEAIASALARCGYNVERIDVRDEQVSDLKSGSFDLAFIALHGPFGEDGGIQRLCERRGIPYTGCGPLASERAMDKAEAKRLFKQDDVPTPRSFVLDGTAGPEDIDLVHRTLGDRVVVKPTNEGSSLGVNLVANRAELDSALAAAWCFGGRAMVEEQVVGRELTVGVLEGRALPIIELRPGRSFFDFQAKYEDKDTEYLVQPELSEEIVEKVQAVALAAHHTLGCEGFSRVDFMLDEDGNPWVLEVNTIPGFTDRSLFPMAAQASGIDYDRLCEIIVEQTITRFRTKAA